MPDFKHVLVPTDFSESSRAALDMAVDLATRYGAALTIVHTCEIPAYAYTPIGAVPIDLLTPVQEAARRALEAMLDGLRSRVPTAQAVLRLGAPAEEILAAAADARADLIVMATHGRRGFSHLLLGSVAERVVRTSSIPVLTVRHRAV
jgi:nucleotide-binding universal stress UspA family protein